MLLAPKEEFLTMYLFYSDIYHKMVVDKIR